MRKESNQEQAEALLIHSMRMASSISFGLLMDREIAQRHGMANDYSIHIRVDQPCYGELAKYQSIHGDAATQKHKRPSDLFWPFPDGKPVGLSLPFHQYGTHTNNKTVELVVRTAFTNDSPWVSGFGAESNVQFVMDGDKFIGVYLKRLNIDPTVLVNLLNHLKSILYYKSTSYEQMSALLDAGMTKPELHVLMNVNGFGLKQMYEWGDDYYSTSNPSFKRYFQQKPRDLTGGTLEDGYSYNRKELHECFSKNGTIHNRDKFKWSDDPKGLVINWREFYTTAMEKEDDPIIEKYVPFNQKIKKEAA